MRIIGTVENERDASLLSQALSRENIECELEPVKHSDWGESNYGTLSFRLWIINEEQVDRAQEILSAYEQNPQDPLFAPSESNIRSLKIPQKDKIAEIPSKIIDISKAARDIQPIGRITYYIILLCSLLFLGEILTQPENWPVPSSLPLTPLYASPVKQMLVFDYPLPYELFNKFVEKFTPEKVLNPQELPIDAENTLAKILNLRYWEGLYQTILDYFKTHTFSMPDVPLFEKIRQGEVWRLFTPALLHGDIFHILFNMLWLYALGRQMEEKLGGLRYLFFILLTGVIVNTAQYLMTGSNFLGFSGILCAMITFVATRQDLAAWEGYRFDRMTKLFIYVFIFGMFFFQLVSFAVEVTTNTSISPGIANTAHLTGLALGAILGRFPFFAWK